MKFRGSSQVEELIRITKLNYFEDAKPRATEL